MNILWSPEAIEDLSSLQAYIAENDSVVARGVVLHIIHNIEQFLPDNPQIGRPGRVPGTRELVIPKTPFIVPYRLQRNIIQILRVYHGARRWPESFQQPELIALGYHFDHLTRTWDELARQTNNTYDIIDIIGLMKRLDPIETAIVATSRE